MVILSSECRLPVMNRLGCKGGEGGREAGQGGGEGTIRGVNALCLAVNRGRRELWASQQWERLKRQRGPSAVLILHLARFGARHKTLTNPCQESKSEASCVP